MTTPAPTFGRSSARRAARVAERRAGRRSEAVHPGLPGGVYKPLSDRDLERIGDTAYAILADIGLSAVTDEIRDYATAKGAHFNAHGRLCFPRALVEDLIANAAREIVYHGRDVGRTIRSGGNRVYFATSGEAVRFVDPVSGKLPAIDAARPVRLLPHGRLPRAHRLLRPAGRRDRYLRGRPAARRQHRLCRRRRDQQAVQHLARRGGDRGRGRIAVGYGARRGRRLPARAVRRDRRLPDRLAAALRPGHVGGAVRGGAPRPAGQRLHRAAGRRDGAGRPRRRARAVHRRGARDRRASST